MLGALAVWLMLNGYIAGVAYLVWKHWTQAEETLVPLDEAVRQIFERRKR